MSGGPVVSVIVPGFNEAGNVATLFSKIDEGLAATGLPGETVFVDDGSVDDTWERVVAERDRRDNVRAFFNPSWALLAEPDVGTLYYNPEWVWNVFDQAIVSRIVCCRAGKSRGPTPGHCRRSCTCTRSAESGKARLRAAASSMASGKPSN